MASEWQQLELPLSLVREAEVEIVQRRRSSAVRPRPDPTAMTLTELLVLILGPSREPICAEIAATYRRLRPLANAHQAELRERGLTEGALNRLMAVFEIARRFGEEEFVPGQLFRGSYDVYAHFRERLAAELREHFVAVLLDNKNRKLRDIIVAIGSLTSTVVHPRLCCAPHNG